VRGAGLKSPPERTRSSRAPPGFQPGAGFEPANDNRHAPARPLYALTSSTFILASPAYPAETFERTWRAIRTGFEPAAPEGSLPKITESLRPALYGAGADSRDRRTFLKFPFQSASRAGRACECGRNSIALPLSHASSRIRPESNRRPIDPITDQRRPVPVLQHRACYPHRPRFAIFRARLVR
jgi:hypothetical protein